MFRRIFNLASLTIIASLAAVGCSDDSGNGNGNGTDIDAASDVVVDADADVLVDAPGDAPTDGSESDADGSSGDTEPTDSDVSSDAATDLGADTADAGPPIPEPEPGDPAVIEPDAELRELGPEGACGVPVELVGRGLRRSPYVQSVFSDSGRIAWTDTFGGSGFVRYSVVGSGEWRVADANVRAFPMSETGDIEDYNAYDATLLGLEPGVDVCYEVYVDGALLVARAAFHSAWTTHDRPVRIVTMGDSGNGSPEQMAIRDRMMEVESDLFLHLGDMAYGDGTYSEFEERVFQVYEALMGSIPAWPTPGNHEYKTGIADGYIGVYYLPEQAWRPLEQEYYYSFDYGNVHFISIDSNEFRFVTTIGNLGDDMLDWLEDDLSNTDADWIIAFMHHPVYSAGRHGNTNWLQAAVVPVLEAHGVDLVLAGHDHHYERTPRILGDELASEGTFAPTYIVAGAGGAGMRDVALPDAWWSAKVEDKVNSFLHLVIDGCTAQGNAIDLEGNVIDTFTLQGCDE